MGINRLPMAMPTISRPTTCRARFEWAKRVIHELPTSIIPLMDQIAVIPLIGPIDATRTECIIEAVSSRMSSFQPKVVFLDITGVPEMNDEVAAHLDEITQAVQSQGVQAMLIGLPED